MKNIWIVIFSIPVEDPSWILNYSSALSTNSSLRPRSFISSWVLTSVVNVLAEEAPAQNSWVEILWLHHVYRAMTLQWRKAFHLIRKWADLFYPQPASKCLFSIFSQISSCHCLSIASGGMLRCIICHPIPSWRCGWWPFWAVCRNSLLPNLSGK